MSFTLLTLDSMRHAEEGGTVGPLPKLTTRGVIKRGVSTGTWWGLHGGHECLSSLKVLCLGVQDLQARGSQRPGRQPTSIAITVGCPR